MDVSRIEDFTGGWFVGDFQPTLYPTNDVEIAMKRYHAGDSESAHLHKIATEFTVIVSGRARMSGKELSDGDVVRIAPGEATDFEALTDLTTLVVKLPCAKGDKYVLEDNAS